MEEMDMQLPQKVHDCLEKKHHMIELREGSNWFYACKDCHYVMEVVNCTKKQNVLVSHS